MKPRVGVSACLVGEPVRYDGGHKLQAPLVEAFEGQVEWVAVCPEIEIGLGVPRETIQLEAADEGVRLISTETGRDLTDTMRTWAAERLGALAQAGLDGYVFKARSPSCGLGTTPVAGAPESRDGLFAEALRARFPALPVCDEERVSEPSDRARFLRSASAHRDLRALFQSGWTRGDVVAFHTRRKLLLMAHSPALYASLGTLVGSRLGSASFKQEYVAGYLAAIAENPTPGRHANALSHAAGYFPPDASLIAAIGRVGSGNLSELDAVKARILERAREHGKDYLLSQLYLVEQERS